MPLTVSDLRAARITPATAYHNFLLNFPRARLRVHAFFEGQDDASFYSYVIERLLPPGFLLHVYQCGNRDMVIQTMRKVDPHLMALDKHRVLFFVDKDLTDILPENDLGRAATNCFITDVYSIENYMTTSTMLRKVCVELLHLSDDDRLVRISTEFDVLMARFHRMLLPLMAYIVVLRRNGYRPQLEDVRLVRYMSVTSDFRLQRHSLDLFALLEGTCGAPKSLRSRILMVARELVPLSPRVWARGKYERWFFLKFIDRVIHVYEQSGDSSTIHTALSDKNFVEVLGPRTAMPATLRAFLEAHFTLCSQAEGK